MKYRIFFDMDGVLVHFILGLTALMNKKVTEADRSIRPVRRLIDYEGTDKTPITSHYLEHGLRKKDKGIPITKWERICRSEAFALMGNAGPAYWEDLKPTPEYDLMIDHAISLVGIDRVHVLSSPLVYGREGCITGKRAWLKTHTKINLDNVQIRPDKPNVVKQYPDDTCILIDDRAICYPEWEHNGGILIDHFPPVCVERVHETIEKLTQIVKPD